jgi:predicted DNA-binding transcriptional regulator YafY
MLDDDALYIARKREDTSRLDLARVRWAIREQCKMCIGYTDQAGAASERVIWPIMLGFVESRRFVAGWCELRQDFGLFRVDRIVKMDFLHGALLETAARWPKNGELRSIANAIAVMALRRRLLIWSPISATVARPPQRATRFSSSSSSIK